MNRTPEFDGLRGLAIGLVLWHHLVGAYLPAGAGSWLGWLKAGTELAWCGVDLFFVLSGYFIGGILLDRWQSPVFARVFYLRRAVRILPLYFATLLLVFAAIAAGWPDAYHAYPGWVYGLFLTNFALAGGDAWDWGPLAVLWSLAVEEQFYLVAPWVVRILTPARIGWLALALVVAAPVVRFTLGLAWPDQRLAPHVLMPARMDTLALGVLIAWSLRTPVSARFYAWLRARWAPSLAAGGVGLLLLAALRFREGDVTGLWFGYSLVALVFALIVAVVAGVRPPGLVRLLSFRPLVALGRHSYFVYLWHMLLGCGIVRWLGGPDFVLDSVVGVAWPLLGFAATWAAAALSWRFFEEPLLRWGHRHAY